MTKIIFQYNNNSVEINADTTGKKFRDVTALAKGLSIAGLRVGPRCFRTFYTGDTQEFQLFDAYAPVPYADELWLSNAEPCKQVEIGEQEAVWPSEIRGYTIREISQEYDGGASEYCVITGPSNSTVYACTSTTEPYIGSGYVITFSDTIPANCATAK